MSDWATSAMGSLVTNGIVKGVSDTQLSPKENISIEQGIILIYRSYKHLVISEVEPLVWQFVDEQKIAQQKWQQKYVGEGELGSNFTDSRIHSLQMIEVYNEISNYSGTYLLFRLEYSLKADCPNSLFLAGGMDIDTDGWMTIGIPPTLVFKKNDSDFIFLGEFITEFDPDGSAQIFRSDLERFLTENDR